MMRSIATACLVVLTDSLLSLASAQRQPNDIPSTVNGCADALISADEDGNGVITRDEHLDFANEIAELLCQPVPLSPELSFDLQTIFITSSCLCQDLDGYEVGCCFGEDAGIIANGAAADDETRTDEQRDYLRSVCLLTQAVLGPSECGESMMSFDDTSKDEMVEIQDTPSPGSYDEETDDIPGTLPGCTAALLANDEDGDWSIRRDEYLGYVNDVADLLCVPPREDLDLQLQTTFISLACLCLEREGAASDCCFADNAAIDVSVVSGFRSEDDELYLRAVCVLTQAIFGHGQCNDESASPSDAETTPIPVSEDPSEAAVAPAANNDISGTVRGCADALLAHDQDNSWTIIERDEYLGFTNRVAELLCVPPRESMDLELQTAFNSIACLCAEQESADPTCCLGENAKIDIEGAAVDADSRTPEQEAYLRSVCLITQAIVGPDQCNEDESDYVAIEEGNVAASEKTLGPTSEDSMDSTSSLRGTVVPTVLATVTATVDISK